MSKFDYYFRYNNLGELRYKLNVNLSGGFIESQHKIVYITVNTKKENNLEVLKHKDSLKLELEIANPPSCKETIYTKLNGIVKDSLTISSINYNYKILPTDLGNNKLEIFIDYSCEDYELKSDYFTLDFNVVE